MSRLFGVSAHRLAGLAICDDFTRKMGIWRRPHKRLETRVRGFWPRARLSFLVNPRLIGIGESVSRCIGVFCTGFVRKMDDFEAALQRTLTEGKRWEASRATKFLSYLAAKLLSNLATWRLIA